MNELRKMADEAETVDDLKAVIVEIMNGMMTVNEARAIVRDMRLQPKHYTGRA